MKQVKVNDFYEQFIRTDPSITLKSFLLSKGFKLRNGQFSGNILRQTKGWVQDRKEYHRELLEKANDKVDEILINRKVNTLEELKIAKNEVLSLAIKRLDDTNIKINEIVRIYKLLKTELGEPIHIPYHEYQPPIQSKISKEQKDRIMKELFN